MQLTEFNQASDSDIELLLKQCVHIDRWAEELKQQRPFTSRDELLEAAKRQAQTWTWEEISKALATHPRIGEKQAQTALTAKEEGFSEREQAAISQDEETQAALLKGNLAYEKKFDFIFHSRNFLKGFIFFHFGQFNHFSIFSGRNNLIRLSDNI